MERKATSRDNPWMSGLWMIAVLGTLIGGVALYLGYLGHPGDDRVVGLVRAAGEVVLTVSLIALVVGVAVSAYLWELRNPED